MKELNKENRENKPDCNKLYYENLYHQYYFQKESNKWSCNNNSNFIDIFEDLD